MGQKRLAKKVDKLEKKADRFKDKASEKASALSSQASDKAHELSDKAAVKMGRKPEPKRGKKGLLALLVDRRGRVRVLHEEEARAGARRGALGGAARPLTRP